MPRQSCRCFEPNRYYEPHYLLCTIHITCNYVNIEIETWLLSLNPLQWRRYLTSSSICPASRVREEWFRKILLTADMQIAASFIWALRLECETFTAPSHNKHKDGLLRIVFRLGWYQCKIHKLELIADQSSALWCSPCNPFILVQKNRSYNLNKIT